MVKKRPNLFVIGAMKSGTTSLHSYLQCHPDIFMCEPKEPFYFVEEKNWKRGKGWYLNLFDDAGDKRIIGESTTGYTKRPKHKGVPERIFKFNPEAKFIYIMRDPVKRTISHYWHNVRWESEYRSMISAVKQAHEYIDVSHYAMQLEPYFDLFGRERVFTLTFEEMTVNKETCLANIFRWLGVSTEIGLTKLEIKKNVTPQQIKQVREFGLLNRFRHSNLWNAIHGGFPKPIKNFARRLAFQPVDRQGVSEKETIQFLKPIQVEQTKKLEKMIFRKFPEWKNLYG
jgi:hypothetical protein